MTTLTLDRTAVENAQAAWAAAVVAVGAEHTAGRDPAPRALELIRSLYAYDHGGVLFKPTLAAETPFRLTEEAALSYFVGGNAAFPEDNGFAIRPWTAVVFRNTGIQLHGETALAMGEYDFTDADGAVTTVEYTFGYRLDPDGDLRICLHHSSLPYKPG